MYRYLDRPVASLGQQEQFLVLAMRAWVTAARAGRCSCRDLRTAFERQRVAETMPDFGILMTTLDRDSLDQLRFGSRCCLTVSSDEARLLALFATAWEGPLARVRRVASTLVVDDAVARVAQAADFVATALFTASTATPR